MGLEWVADMSDMAMDVQLGPAGVTAGFDLRFRSLRSPFSLAMLGSARKDIPPEFWKVPSDADLAFYFPGASTEVMQAAAAPMWSRAMEVGVSAPVAEAWRGTITKLSKVLLTGGPLIVAHGPGPNGPFTPQDPA